MISAALLFLAGGNPLLVPAIALAPLLLLAAGFFAFEMTEPKR